MRKTMFKIALIAIISMASWNFTAFGNDLEGFWKFKGYFSPNFGINFAALNIRSIDFSKYEFQADSKFCGIGSPESPGLNNCGVLREEGIMIANDETNHVFIRSSFGTSIYTMQVLGNTLTISNGEQKHQYARVASCPVSDGCENLLY